eukprot:CAMPEP_0176255176 /NCGR_PEP_ID=MMETSP0121_2-20121125/36907_1 /TAXON_ID=160619 /ORGANISM="Kryptoperidinium foliaceum, Strain CCMP 1326" /LENGTH=420 /DNA_ID=CAMNT_0017594997 /DNA_START=105 /DNA_END=1364 /DNA_ORIENTATION=-
MTAGVMDCTSAWPPGYAAHAAQPGMWSTAAPQLVYGQAPIYMMQTAQMQPPAQPWPYPCPVMSMAPVMPHGQPAVLGNVSRSGSFDADARQAHTEVQQPQKPQLPGGALAELMQELKIAPHEEESFRWIAEYGLLPDAQPPGWALQVDTGTQRVYFVNEETQESQWQNPLKPHLLNVVEAAREYLAHPTVDFFDGVKQLAWERNRQELKSWHGPFTDDDTGESYYVNSTTGDSTWQDPREIAQYLFELESSLLDSLRQVLPALADLETSRLGSTKSLGSANSMRGRKITTLGGAEWMKISKSDMSSSTSEGSSGPKRKVCVEIKSLAMEDAAQERCRALRAVGRAYDWLQDVSQAEEASQRRELFKKVELRRLRKQRLSAKVQGAAAASNAALAAPCEALGEALGAADGCTWRGVPPTLE